MNTTLHTKDLLTQDTSFVTALTPTLAQDITVALDFHIDASPPTGKDLGMDLYSYCDNVVWCHSNTQYDQAIALTNFHEDAKRVAWCMNLYYGHEDHGIAYIMSLQN